MHNGLGQKEKRARPGSPTRAGFCVVGWDADLRAEPELQEQATPARMHSPGAVWSEATEYEVL